VVKALVDNGAGVEKQNKVCAFRNARHSCTLLVILLSCISIHAKIRRGILLSTKQATMGREE